MDETAIEVRSVANDGIQICGIVIVIATASTVLATKACDWQRHILIVCSFGVGVVPSTSSVAETVWMVVGIVVGSICPPCWPEESCCSYCEPDWQDAERRPSAR